MTDGATSSGRSRRWIFTRNNPVDTGDQYLATLYDSLPKLQYCILQLEKGEQGTLHYQGYLRHSTVLSLQKLRSVDPSAHYEIARGDEAQCISYCSKDDTRQAGPWERGDRQVGQGHRTDLATGAALVADGGLSLLAQEAPTLLIKYPRGFQLYQSIIQRRRDRTNHPSVRLFIGPPGAGKTRRAYELDPDLFAAPLSNGTIWFDGYNAQETILIDDFDGRKSKWTLSFLLRFIDRYPVDLPIKGGHVPLQATQIIITTNYTPQVWYDWETRRAQWGALVRRFTSVTQWFPDDSDRNIFHMRELTPGQLEWDIFWIL